jgi:hypothetical protein
MKMTGLGAVLGVMVLVSTQAQASLLASWKLDKATDVKKASFHVQKPAVAKRSFDAQVVNPDGTKGAMRVDIDATPAKAGTSWKQLWFTYKKGLQAGHRYRVSFYCKASKPVEFSALAMMSGKPWRPVDPHGNIKVKATDQWQEVSFTMAPTKDWTCTIRTPQFPLGKIEADTQLWLYNVRFEDITE